MEPEIANSTTIQDEEDGQYYEQIEYDFDSDTTTPVQGRSIVDLPFRIINEKGLKSFTKLKLRLPHSRDTTPIEIEKLKIDWINDGGEFIKSDIMNLDDIEWQEPEEFKSTDKDINIVGYRGFRLPSKEVLVCLQRVVNNLGKIEIRLQQIFNDTNDEQIILVDEINDNSYSRFALTFTGIVAFIGGCTAVAGGIAAAAPVVANAVTSCVKAVRSIRDLFRSEGSVPEVVTEDRDVAFIPGIFVSELMTNGEGVEQQLYSRSVRDVDGKMVSCSKVRHVRVRDEEFHLLDKIAYFVRKSYGIGLPRVYFDFGNKLKNLLDEIHDHFLHPNNNNNSSTGNDPMETDNNTNNEPGDDSNNTNNEQSNNTNDEQNNDTNNDQNSSGTDPGDVLNDAINEP